ncbi:MAG: hypothetical protein GXP53_04735 [Deltaproteobacteria bacterium]|nr:hypothetical protein [Deltaproteobacteria bacterium]
MFFRKKITLISIFFIVGALCVPQLSAALSLNQYLNNNVGQTGNSILISSAQLEVRDNSLFASPATDTSRMNLRNAHKIFGYSTLLFAAMAGLSGGDNGLHKGTGIATAVMAVAACATGYSQYGDYFDKDEGLSAYNVHIVLGTMAAAGFVATAAMAGSNGGGGHAGAGIASTVLAVIPVIVIKW